MDLWRSENNPGLQDAMSLGCAVVGAILMIGFRHFSAAGPGMTDSLAGFLLGILLLGVGVVAFMVGGKQTIVIDPRTRLISIEDITRIGTKRHVIPFRDIVEVNVSFLGKKSNLTQFYYLALKLKSGERYPLFGPGKFYEGGSNRSVVEGWQWRLESYLALPSQ